MSVSKDVPDTPRVAIWSWNPLCSPPEPQEAWRPSHVLDSVSLRKFLPGQQVLTPVPFQGSACSLLRASSEA